MEWLESTNDEYREYSTTTADGLKLKISDRGEGHGQRRFDCRVLSADSRTYRHTDLVDDLEFAKGWVIRAAKSAVEEIAKDRLHEAAPALLAACQSARAWLGERPDENDGSKWGVHYEVRRSLIDQLDAAIGATQAAVEQAIGLEEQPQ